MFEQKYILNKIEQWAERLPYKTLKIEVELPNQSLVLEKTRNRPVGFAPPPMKDSMTFFRVSAQSLVKTVNFRW